ncbi:MAG: DUF4093 domain-containing protein [Firmicutes bacterium]|nr:DUF4093 domain-containing protein [Bacillota bacterium]
MEKIRVRPVILVEGKYDKIKLESLVDGFILTTDGFGIFADKERLELIRRLAAARGVLVLTDSDGAGFVIRNYLSGVLPPEQVRHAYIPDLFGKEKRKRTPSKEGKLGVEGMNRATLLNALRRAGVTGDAASSDVPKVTKLDLFEDGFSGGENSARLRSRLLSALDLPQRMSANAMLQAINSFLDYDEYKALAARLRRDGE